MSAPTHITHIGLPQAICIAKLTIYTKSFNRYGHKNKEYTLHAYRNKLKNRAFSRNDFEKRVMRIGAITA